MRERFVSEAIEPVLDSIAPHNRASGAPGMPGRFIWRGREYGVADVLETWKDTSPCTHGSGEQYVRKHWFRIRTGCGAEMTIYFERKARSKREKFTRWWLYTITGHPQTRPESEGH